MSSSRSRTPKTRWANLGRGLREASALLRDRERDLSARFREVEEARGEVDQFFSLSLDMLCIASVDGQFTRVNSAWQQVLGWAAEDLISVPFVQFVHPDDVGATIAETAALASGGITVGFENRYRCKDGSYRWLSWKAASDPARGFIYAAARDVTEQRQAAAALQEHAAELAAVNHELEAFSYSVSHDLRAPLRHVTGFASLLDRHAGEALDEKGRRYLNTIADAATRMGRLIDDLLTFSRMGRAQLTTRPVDLAELTRDVQREVGADVDGREIVWTVRDLPVVQADPAMLRLVLANLLSNAVKYTGTRPRAEIEVGANGHEPGQVVIFVRDNGVGFDAQYTHKLFGVFQRLHSSDQFDGTGIGLANVKRIIQRHGGRTWAEGAVDGGATFYFSLPVKGDNA